MPDALARLTATIAQRRSADPDTSWVARLTAAGRGRMAQKLGEEAVETVIAAVRDDHAGVVSEAADLVFHLAVLLADMGITLQDVVVELERREGTSGVAEKAARS